MADPRVRPTSPGPPDRGVPRWPETESRSAKSPSQDDYLLIDRLREDAVMGRMDLDTVLSEATHAARYFTDAAGAALALWSQGVVICRARSGDTAPPLGAKLDVESGVSGECLRSGRSKRCNDTLTDPLVDAQVCQELGIRSLAAVPLRGEHGVVGILEVFADRPYAFSDAHITLLKQLAQIAVAGRARSMPAAPPSPAPPKTQASAMVTQPKAVRPVIAPPKASLDLKLLRFAALVSRMKGEEGQPYRLAAAGVLLLLVLGSVGWIYFRGRGSSNSAAESVHAASNGTVPPNTNLDAPAESNLDGSQTLTLASPRSRTLTPKPTPEVVAQDLIRRASKSEVTNRTSSIEVQPSSSAAKPSNAASEEVQVPDSTELRAANNPLPQILSAQPNMPTVALRMSQGVTGGNLTHRVSPIYPQQARMLRVEGAVVLDAEVGEDGNVHSVKVVKGDRILAAAATDAVQQWRYQPFELNGKPISMHTQIMIQFKLP